MFSWCVEQLFLDNDINAQPEAREEVFATQLAVQE
jgi:hypothetical protein